MPSDSAISLMQASRPIITIIKEIGKICKYAKYNTYVMEAAVVEDLTQ
jgi:hypothetical protein